MPDEAVAPDLIEPLLAWRVWQFCEPRVHVLHAISSRDIWPPKQRAEAICFAVRPGAPEDRSHLAPVHTCACGFWALKSREGAEQFLANRAGFALKHGAPVVNLVWGEVALWGHVIEHRHGYRAQFGYPRSLYVPTFFRVLTVEPGETRARRVRASEAANQLSDL
jgi:hypothetical protein